jgi:hypothetical protein
VSARELRLERALLAMFLDAEEVWMKKLENTHMKMKT